MNGLGFFIWHIKELFPLERSIAILQRMGVRWVSIKTMNGIYYFSYVDEQGVYTGKPDVLKTVIQSLKAAGISVGGWTFAFPDNPVEQARRATRQIEEFGLEHWLIDAEHIPGVGALWYATGTAKNAKQYLDNLNVPAGFPVGLCSYRYPSCHPQFPFRAFFDHSRVTLNAPQMYWMQAHNPRAQLLRCLEEHRAFRPLPQVPIGSAFKEHGWEPTVADLKEFLAAVGETGCQGWGFWSFDQVIYRPEWQEGIGGNPPQQPVLQPEKSAEERNIRVWEVVRGPLNVRSSIIPSRIYGKTPGMKYTSSTVYFSLPVGHKVEQLEEVVDGRNVWLRVGQRQYVAKEYDGVRYLEQV